MASLRKLGLPWSVQIELSEGCSRICSFCGLNGIRTGPGNYKFLTVETGTLIAKQLASFCPNVRIEFAMHGEPLMNPNHVEILNAFRRYLPTTQIMVTTNGGPLRKEMHKKLDALYSAGVDFVVLDTYYPERDELQLAARGLPGDITVWDFYEDCVPKGWSVYANHNRKYQRLLIIMDDIGVRNGEVASRTLMNHAGNMKDKPIPAQPLEKTCTNPFRELSVCWNGDINVCCMDWAHESVMGNVHTSNLREIWFGPEFEAFRTALQNHDRRMTPCSRCDKNSGTRAGLLPKYPEVTQNEIDVINAVHAKNPHPANGFKPECNVTPGTLLKK